jgi:hypothetical protein
VALLAVGGFFAWRWVDTEFINPPVETFPDAFAFDELPPGPCWDLEVEDGLLMGWTEVSCDGPRDTEVSYAESFLDGSYPGDDFLDGEAADMCQAAFERYIGLTPTQSIYDMDWLRPTEDLWAGGSRQAICLVISDDGSPLTGTVKGSAQ